MLQYYLLSVSKSQNPALLCGYAQFVAIHGSRSQRQQMLFLAAINKDYKSAKILLEPQLVNRHSTQDQQGFIKNTCMKIYINALHIELHVILFVALHPEIVSESLHAETLPIYAKLCAIELMFKKESDIYRIISREPSRIKKIDNDIDDLSVSRVCHGNNRYRMLSAASNLSSAVSVTSQNQQKSPGKEAIANSNNNI